MSAVTRKGDKNTGHGDYPAVALNTGSSNVFINNAPCGRKSDTYPSHNKGGLNPNPHRGQISSGSSTVFVNGLPIARVKDTVSCGGKVVQGSPNVYAN